MTPRAFLFLSELSHTHLPAQWSTYFIHRTFWVTVIMLAITPLCFIRDITKLGFSGALSGVAIVYLIAVINVEFFTGYSRAHHLDAVAPHAVDAMTALLQAIPLFFCAYSVSFQVGAVSSGCLVYSQR
jgi:amino acid permease